jgi:general secretion pathway protein I
LARITRRQKGFTLLEVVVAFVLLAVALTTIFQIFSAGMSRAHELEYHSQALAIAQSKLAAAGVETVLKEGIESGQSEDRRFSWNVAVRLDPDTAEVGTTQALPLLLYRVDVRVSWEAGQGRTKDVSLATLVLGARP